jgi:hypothetical protein
MILSSATAELRLNGTRIGKVRNIQPQINRAALETTTLDSWDNTFTNGLRTSTISATILFDPEDATAVTLFNTILEDKPSPSGVTVVFDRLYSGVVPANHLAAKALALECSCLITSVSPGIAFGDLIAVQVSMQVTGKPTGTFSRPT